MAGIGASAALAVGCVGMFVLTPDHHVSPVKATGSVAVVAGSQPTPSLSPSPQKSSPKPSPSHRPRKHHAAPHAPAPNPQVPNVGVGNVFVGVAVKGGIMSGVRSFSRATGAHMALVEIYARFGASFPGLEAGRVVSAGSSPLIQWNPRGAPLGQIAAGTYNTYLRKWASAVKAFGHHVVLSFGHEMNGPWSQWGPGHASPAKFVAAWRRIHNVFASANVRNVSWSWDPSHTGDPPHPWWPGSRYVNQIGIDGYQRNGQTFAQIFASRLADIRTFASKPIFIAETSVAPGPGQAIQIANLFNGVEQYHLNGFVWFDINGLEAWHLEGRPAAVRAFRRSVAQMNG
jgi:hypothetical protein